MKERDMGMICLSTETNETDVQIIDSCVAHSECDGEECEDHRSGECLFVEDVLNR